MTGKMLGNLHIFVNSVDFIVNVIRKSGLQPNDVKIVCSNNPELGSAKNRNQRKLGEEYPIEKPLDPVKKINFYTSTCFEGCDIYDERGRVYIVSDGNKSHTQLDVSTLLIQICGRIRNSVYNDITHIFSYTRYKGDVSVDEFEEKTFQNYEQSQRMIDYINQMDDEIREKTINGFSEYYCNDNYIAIEDGRLLLDRNLLNLDVINFKIATGVYSSRVAYIEELKKNGLEHGFNKYDYHQCVDALTENPNAKLSFKDIFEHYVELQANKSGFGILNEELNVLGTEKPLVREAYYKLGVDRVRELKYHVGNIRIELVKISNIPDTKKIREMILDRIGFGIHADRFIKAELQSIYNDLGVQKVAKATTVNDYFLTKPSIRNGERCTEIIREKIIYNN